MTARRALTRFQQGMNTAEYAAGTTAACGFACLLLQLLPIWRALLTEIFRQVLEIRFGSPITRIPL
ncbi:MAG: DUF4244 domain-containing protein [Nocardioidaceae bacterium]